MMKHTKEMSSEAIIRETLSAYGMADAAYQLIRQNENLTCKVTNHGECYSLRIYKQVGGFNTSLFINGRSAVELFQSEISLLNYIQCVVIYLRAVSESVHRRMVCRRT